MAIDSIFRFGRLQMGLLIILGTAFHGQSAKAVGFDCNRARGYVEELICSDNELSNLDDKLTRAYNDARLHSEDPDLIRQDERDWIKQRRLCQNRTCIVDEYARRLGELLEAARPSPTPDVGQYSDLNRSALPPSDRPPGSSPDVISRTISAADVIQLAQLAEAYFEAKNDCSQARDYPQCLLERMAGPLASSGRRLLCAHPDILTRQLGVDASFGGEFMRLLSC